MPLNFQGKKYYSSLISKPEKKGALFDFVPRSSLYQHLLVCFAFRSGETEHDYHYYSNFDSYVEFFHHMVGMKEDYRTFFEVILGEYPQKPHFDIDLSPEKAEGFDLEQLGNSIKDYTLTAIIEVLKQAGVTLKAEKDILLYSSSNEKKVSYHIVIDNYMHLNNNEAKAFHKRVMEYLKEKYGLDYLNTPTGPIVDPKVYSTTQQFRIVGNRKQGSDRVKVFNENFTIFDRKYQHEYSEAVDNPARKVLVILKESLVSFTSGCKLLPQFMSEEEVKRRELSGKQTAIEITDELLKEAIGLLKRYFRNDDYTFDQVDDYRNEIRLKRNRASHCQLCQRVHEHQNPYLRVRGSWLIWHCRQYEGPGLVLGMLESKIIREADEKEDEEEGFFQFGSKKIGEKEEKIEVAEKKIEEVKEVRVEKVKEKKKKIKKTRHEERMELLDRVHRQMN